MVVIDFSTIFLPNVRSLSHSPSPSLLGKHKNCNDFEKAVDVGILLPTMLMKSHCHSQFTLSISLSRSLFLSFGDTPILPISGKSFIIIKYTKCARELNYSAQSKATKKKKEKETKPETCLAFQISHINHINNQLRDLSK